MTDFANQYHRVVVFDSSGRKVLEAKKAKIGPIERKVPEHAYYRNRPDGYEFKVEPQQDDDGNVFYHYSYDPELDSYKPAVERLEKAVADVRESRRALEIAQDEAREALNVINAELERA